ncbi:SigE family RNA polymerase sigma factor, partial [Streptomyces sp. SID7499]|nr:SigE family RNA polymerase sigma factor [Streptomyces sp. SID7499]
AVARETGGHRSAAPVTSARVPAQRSPVTSVPGARAHTPAQRNGRHDERGMERCAA